MDPGSRFFFNFCDFCFSWTMDHALSQVNSNFPGCLITQGILYPDVYKYYTEKYKTWKIK